MPMRATTVRFSEDLWKLLEREAEREGVSAAQFIRDATIMRAAYAMGRRGDAELESGLAQMQGGNGGPDAERRQALLDGRRRGARPRPARGACARPACSTPRPSRASTATRGSPPR